MPWLSQVSAVWTPGTRARGRHRGGPSCSARSTRRATCRSPSRGPVPGARSSPASSRHRRPGAVLRGHRRRLPVYDANNETPLFPLVSACRTPTSRSATCITPQQVQNACSNPGPTCCRCNGQGSRQVTVSATVTNTGKVAGSEVAQLYLGDPAAAGEPPRQLKGFEKVTLQPGQSTTVRFTLTGHDLSYWDSAANGWVLPDGRTRSTWATPPPWPACRCAAASPSPAPWAPGTPRPARPPRCPRAAPPRCPPPW